MNTGDKINLSVVRVPADSTDSYTASWTTSNPNVATVANGVVTAVATGEATITAKVNVWTVTYKITVTDKTGESTTVEESTTEEPTTLLEEPSTEEITTDIPVTEPVTQPVVAPIVPDEDFSYNGYSFSIPFGIGVKYSMNERLGLTLEWTMHKTFTDYIDDIHGLYPETPVVVDGVNYTDPSGLYQPGMQRGNGTASGFGYNCDWFGTLQLTILYRFNLPRKNVCHSGL